MSMATSTAIGLGLGVAGLGSSVATGIIGSNAAKDSTNAQVNAANNAAALQKQAADNSLAFQKLQYGNSLNLLAPFYNTGTSANSRLAYLMGLTPNQGLPPGVTNPNAPQSTNNGFEGGSGIPAGMGGFNGTTAGGANGGGSFGLVGDGPGIRSQNPRFNSLMAMSGGQNFTGGPTLTNQNITGGPSGIMSFGGGPNNAGIGPGGNPVATANGSPGQVPRTDGGGNPSAPAADGSVPGGSFGSLAQGWNQTFQSPTDVTEQNDPGYQFRLQQGQQALQNSAAARGGLLSGGTAKALTDYNQNAASGEYGNVYNRALQNYNTNYNTFTNDQTNLFNRLASLSGQGQVTANNLSSAGLSNANSVSSILTGAANNIGQDYQNAGAATASGYNNGATSLSNSITGGLSSTMQLLKLLQTVNGGGGGGNPFSSDPTICWIAESLYGVDDPRTHLMRSWMKKVVRFDPVGKFFFNAYLKYGERVAELVKRFRPVRAIFRAIFDRCLVHARLWEAERESRKPFEDFQGLEYQR